MKQLFRFPLTIFIAIVGTTCAMIMSFESSWNLSQETIDQIGHILITLIALLPISITIKLLQERYHWDRKQSAIGYSILALLALSYYFMLPFQTEKFYEWQMLRMVIMVGVAFLSAFFVPFLIAKEDNGFWYFSKQILTRLFFTVLFAGALFAGISVTLASIQYLFELNIAEEYFGRIWLICAGIVAPWFLLGGVPGSLATLQQEDRYGELLKKFIQFILFPILTIYTLVLYAYGVKILITSSWPSGDTVYLIAGYVISGLLTYALAFPLLKNSNVTRKITRVWLITLLPVLILYFAAIYLRIEQYGVTLGRYFVVLLGIFYVTSCFYLLASRRKNIIVIPVLFSVLAVIGNFGPVSAYAITKWSQLGRLEKLAKEQPVSKEKIDEVTSYVVDTFGKEVLEK